MEILKKKAQKYGSDLKTRFYWKRRKFRFKENS